MSNDIGKISVRQAMLLFIIVFCAPAIRYIPLYTTQQAKQAAWLSPLIAFIFEIIYILVWCGFLKKYEKKSFVDIIKDIIGKIMGNVVCIIYFIWITFLLTYNVRMYGERIVSTAMPDVSIIIILAAMLLTVGYIIKNGIIPLSKMNEMFFILLAGIFIIYNILILPAVKVKNLFPITYKDALPIFNANAGVIAIFAYIILIFMFNDKIDHKGEFKKLGIKTVITISIISLLVIATPLCVFGASIVSKMPIPYLNTMMEISMFDILERVEAGIIMFWVITDFVSICVFVFSAIHMVRLTFNLTNVRPLATIYILGVFFLTLVLAKSTIELKAFSENIITQANIIMGYILPIVIFGIGKIRKKV